MTLTVASLDRALNESPVATYTIFVKSTAPTIRQLVPNPPVRQADGVRHQPQSRVAGGKPGGWLHRAVLRPDPADVQRQGLGQRHCGGVGLTPDQSGFYDLEVFGTTRNGLELAPYDYFFTVN